VIVASVEAVGAAPLSAATVVPPEPEDRVAGLDEAALSRLAEAAGHPVGEVPPPPDPRSIPGKRPLHLPLLVLALALLPLDVLVRRVFTRGEPEARRKGRTTN
jgi:hypothetical protein